MKTMFKALLVVAALGFCMLPAHADQIFICQSCTAAPGGDPNPITNTSSFDVGLAGGGTDQSPLFIVVGVYGGGVTPTVSFNGTASEPMATLGIYGLSSNSLTVSASSTGTKIFQALGLNSGGSESIGNLIADDAKFGIAAPSKFTFDVFQIPTALHGVISIDEAGAPVGSFILAYGCQDGSTTAKCDEGDVSQTVNTNMGILTGPPVTTPEPESLLLLGLGLASLAVFTIRRPAANLI